MRAGGAHGPAASFALDTPLPDFRMKTGSHKPWRFDESYCEIATLRDGSRVTLRLVCPSDKELIKQGFERMSPASRYRRFLAAKSSLSEQDLKYLTEIDGVDHFAIGATLVDARGRQRGLGIARFVRSKSDPRTAEAAVAVVDDFQNKGLGTLLLLRLAAAARERGIERFEARALAENLAVREVIEQLGPGAHVAHEADEMVIEVDLPDVPADVLPAEAPDNPLQRMLSLSARGLLAARRMVTQLERVVAHS